MSNCNNLIEIYSFVKFKFKNNLEIKEKFNILII